MALAGDFPVVPVVHWGTQDVYEPYVKGGFHPLPRKDIRVVAGPPVDLSEFRGKPVDARLIREVSYVIQGAVRDLLAQVRGVQAPPDFYDQKKQERLAARSAQSLAAQAEDPLAAAEIPDR